MRAVPSFKTVILKNIVANYRRRRAVVYRWAHVILPLGILLGLVWVRSAGFDWTEYVQHKAFDGFHQLAPRAYEEAPVRIIDIDDESLSRLGQWPWPRTLVSRFIGRLDDLGASVIALDIVFAEPDRTSPSRVIELWPDRPEITELAGRVKGLPDHDALLAKAFSSANVVTGFVLTDSPNIARPAAKASFAYGGDPPIAYLHDFRGAISNLEQLEKAASGNGSFGFLPEHDGVIRRVPLIFRQGKTLLPSLPLEALRVAQGAKNFMVKTSGGSGEESFGEHTGIVQVKVGEFAVPTDEKGRIWLHYTREAPSRTIPAWKIFDKSFKFDLEGAILFVGSSAAGQKDLRATPLNPAAAGVEVHANIAEQILLGRFKNRPDFAPGMELLYMLVFGLGLIVLLPRLGAGWCAWIAIAGVWGACLFAWTAFNRGTLIDPVFPSASVLLIYVSSSLISFLKSETERRQVRSAFSRYMHPKLVEELARHPEKLRLGGETRTMTILFCDIRGFTTISEQYDAHGLTQVINLFLTPMTEIIMERLGYIDKYIGDCIMAFWNAPLDDAKHAQNACEAALNMQKRLSALNQDWEAAARSHGKKHIPIHIGIGLNTGDCCVGNMGSDQRFNYSVLGDDVNLASRLEGQSKTYGVDIVIGHKTRDLASDFASIELDLIKVKGKTKPERIFALMGSGALRRTPEFQAHDALHRKMLEAYRGQKFQEAKRLLKECRSGELPLGGLYDLYESRIAAFSTQPPAADWDGTFTATSK